MPVVGFVINENGNSIALFDPSKDEVTGALRIVNASEFPTETVASALSKPHLAAFDKQSRRLYVGNKGANLSVFDLSDMAAPRLVASVKPGGSGEIHRVVLAGGLVWLAHMGDSAVYAYDPTDFTAPRVALGKDKGFNTTHGLTLRPGTDELWSTNRPAGAPGFVLRIDVKTRTVIGQPLMTTGKVGDMPNNIEFTDDGKWAYVVNTGSKATEVTLVDADKFEVTQQIVQDARVGVSPHAITFEPVTRRMFIVNMTSGTLSAISTRTNSVLGYFTFAADAHGVTIGPDGQVYAAARAGNAMLVLDPRTLAITKEIKDPLLGGPHYVIFTSDAPLAQVATATATSAPLPPTSTPVPPTALPPTAVPAPPSPVISEPEPTMTPVTGTMPGMPSTGMSTFGILVLILLVAVVLMFGFGLVLSRTSSHYRH
jgi:DNA-binding beta-propeller fold protein YncE